MKASISGKFVSGLLVAASLGLAQAAPAAPDASGEQLFRARCQVCHSIVPGRSSPMAPNLAGVVGRQAGKAAYAYSAGFEKSTVVWTSENLDKFLANPAQFMPGTRMPIGTPDSAQRAALIAYLATVK